MKGTTEQEIAVHTLSLLSTDSNQTTVASINPPLSHTQLREDRDDRREQEKIAVREK
eukprot:m.206502 g.206502  ORF g.206502 m.206502 type:complete len:57 (+) comp53895_c0_seq5:227-397(+)